MPFSSALPPFKPPSFTHLPLSPSHPPSLRPSLPQPLQVLRTFKAASICHWLGSPPHSLTTPTHPPSLPFSPSSPSKSCAPSKQPQSATGSASSASMPSSSALPPFKPPSFTPPSLPWPSVVSRHKPTKSPSTPPLPPSLPPPPPPPLLRRTYERSTPLLRVGGLACKNIYCPT